MTTRQPFAGKPRDDADRILRWREVSDRVQLGRSRIYELMARGTFPEAVKLSSRSVGWWESEIEEWRRARPRTGKRALP